jgi:malonyl-CoA decarboxylase
MTLQRLHSDDFNNNWLEYMHQDPVHSITDERPLSRRMSEDREIFMLVENSIPAAVLCVAYTNTLPDVIDEILNAGSNINTEPRYAIFYSVFKTDATTTIANPGAKIIRMASAWIRENMPAIRNFVTMSPIPALSTDFTVAPTDPEQIRGYLENRQDPVARFHTNNGARVHRIIPNADASPRRLQQSWGFMANYDYTESVIAK